MSQQDGNTLVSNRRAFHDYEILDVFEAGIVLKGTEVKSLREHAGSLQDAYVLVSGGHVLLKEASIAPYRFGNIYNHPEKRARQLLLHKKEIEKLRSASAEKGLAIIPLALYLKSGYVKVKLALARGKKLYDKRETAKRKEDQRTMERAMKGRYS